MASDRDRKLASMRQILKRMPKWLGPYTHVRFDRDGEVVLGNNIDFSDGHSRSLGYVSSEGAKTKRERVRLHPEFAPHQTCEDAEEPDDALIGYAFNRMEYEILKAVVEAEDDESLEVTRGVVEGRPSNPQSQEGRHDQEDDTGS